MSDKYGYALILSRKFAGQGYPENDPARWSDCVARLQVRYTLDRISVKKRNVWGKVSAEIEVQFAYEGPILYGGVDEPVRENSVVTVGVVVGDLDQVCWKLGAIP